MVQAPVGWQCRKCIKSDSRSAPVQRWRPVAGGQLGNTRITPLVIALIAVNVAVYVWEMSTKPGYFSVAGQPSFCPLAHVAECQYGLIPAAVHHGQWYRLLTSAFLHANISHIAFNMFTLAIVGPPVEVALGRVRFVALYLVSALGGSVASYLLNTPGQIGVGASGAIFGLFGAYFVIARRQRWDTSAILALIGVNLFIGFASTTVDWRAHIGGLVTGTIVGVAMSRSRTGWRLSPAGEMAVGIGAAVVVAAVLSLLATLPPGQVNL
jgi:membrane associated rhomboid family serine protease